LRTVNYSALRKKLQKEGEIPEWFTTGGTQLFYEKYSYNGETVKSRYTSIAKALAQHAPKEYPEWWEEDAYTRGKNWEQVFFKTMWDGFISPSTPLLANGGLRKRGTTVSCAGSYVGNNLASRYDVITESAVLTKHSHGTSCSIQDWPHEGAELKRGGHSLGTPPLIRDLVATMNEVTQGSRRGSLVYSLKPQHGDFEWVLQNLYENPESNNVGWLIDDEFNKSLTDAEEEAIIKFQRALKVKLVRGKGYFTFIDKCNRKLAEPFKRKGLTFKASNLCVAPETKVLTRQGYIPIEELAGEEVDVWNGEGWSCVTPVQTGEDQKLFKVLTSSGQSLECTDYHKWYVFDGYGKPFIEKRTYELKEGDKLIKFDLPVVDGEKELNFAYDNGFYSGDGSCIDGRAHIYLYHEKMKLKDKLESVKNFRYSEKEKRMVGRAYDLKEKFFVPDNAYSIESRLDWLAGFLDADGCVYRNGINEALVASSINLEFLKEVQMMLQTLGISCKISQMAEEGYKPLPANDGSGKNKEYFCQDAYRLLISSYDSFRLLDLGLSLNRLEIKKRRPQRDAKQFNKIVSVVDEGRRDATFCLTEPKRNMVLFNGLLTGNCQETILPADENYTFSCVILNYNLELYRNWPDHIIHIGQIMSDCNVSEYLATIAQMSEVDQIAMRKIKRFTEEFRSLGSGVLGWHTLMQKERIVVGSLPCMWLDDEIFSRLDKDSRETTQWLAKVQGEPLGCEGLGIRNATRLMMPPTKSTAEIMAGASEGIGLDMSMVFTKQSAGGEFFRINKVLLEIMKERGVYNDETIMRLAKKRTVKGEDWLDEHEQKVFRNAFEISMEDYLRLCSKRANKIDQMQSINLYFTSKDDESYISKIHRIAFEDENIYSLYYIYSMRGSGEIERDDCAVCM
jgi:ribonucleoside-diphosphate reductase alpha chain